jgi:hypothetical protein
MKDYQAIFVLHMIDWDLRRRRAALSRPVDSRVDVGIGFHLTMFAWLCASLRSGSFHWSSQTPTDTPAPGGGADQGEYTQVQNLDVAVCFKTYIFFLIHLRIYNPLSLFPLGLFSTHTFIIFLSS